MKLKDFVVNSLPRSKSKKKKASLKLQQQQQQALSNSNKCHENENKNISSPCSSAPSSPDVTLNKSLVTDDFYYLSKLERDQPLPKGTYINVNNLNVNEVNKKCQCYKQISPCVSPPTSPYDRPLSSPGYSSDGNFNTIPRVRTRIKTNPWLPSPRTSTTDSPMSSEASSPTYASPQRLTFDNSFSSDNNNYSRYDPSILCTLTRTKDRKTKRHRSDSDSVYSSDNDSLLQRSVMSDTDNSVHTPAGHTRLAYDVFGERLYSTTPRKPRRHQKCSSLASESEQTASDVSFEYEEAFESQMEPDTLAAALGSRDSLDDFYVADLEFTMHTPTSRSRQQSPAGNSTLKFRPNLNKYYDDSCETDDTLCENSLRRRKLHSKSSQDSIDHTKASTSESEMDHEKDGRGPSSRRSSSNNNKEAHNEMQESFDSAFESAPGTCSMSSSFVSNLTTTSESENPTDRRRLDEIRSSLSQKVRKLREEKLLVDAKIRQAQEEERIRAQEMARFQKQLTQYRKQLLLQTLRDLKSQLDNQSQRLQTAYSTVLDTKLHEIHQRNSGRPLGVDKATGMSH